MREGGAWRDMEHDADSSSLTLRAQCMIWNTPSVCFPPPPPTHLFLHSPFTLSHICPHPHMLRLCK
eukprot:351159-Chlamydomonas_euryale.AAC.11